MTDSGPIEVLHAAEALARLRIRSDRLDGTFQTTAQNAVDAMAAATSMRQWTLNRRAGDTYVILCASRAESGLRTGDRVPWSETICALMVDGRGPRVAGRLNGTVYESAGTSTVRAYMGV